MRAGADICTLLAIDEDTPPNALAIMPRLTSFLGTLVALLCVVGALTIFIGAFIVGAVPAFAMDRGWHDVAPSISVHDDEKTELREVMRLRRKNITIVDGAGEQLKYLTALKVCQIRNGNYTSDNILCVLRANNRFDVVSAIESKFRIENIRRYYCGRYSGYRAIRTCASGRDVIEIFPRCCPRIFHYDFYLPISRDSFVIADSNHFRVANGDKGPLDRFGERILFSRNFSLFFHNTSLTFVNAILEITDADEARAYDYANDNLDDFRHDIKGAFLAAILGMGISAIGLRCVGAAIAVAAVGFGFCAGAA